VLAPSPTGQPAPRQKAEFSFDPHQNFLPCVAVSPAPLNIARFSIRKVHHETEAAPNYRGHGRCSAHRAEEGAGHRRQ
jgi:hypothetical protein